VLASVCVVLISCFLAPGLSIRNGLVSESISGCRRLFYVIQVTSDWGSAAACRSRSAAASAFRNGFRWSRRIWYRYEYQIVRDHGSTRLQGSMRWLGRRVGLAW